MNNKLILSGLALLTLAFQSCKTTNFVNAEIQRDCSGTYVRINNEDYLVCNKDELNKFDNGDKVELSINKIKECTPLKDSAVCLLYHENKGWVNVQLKK